MFLSCFAVADWLEEAKDLKHPGFESVIPLTVPVGRRALDWLVWLNGLEEWRPCPERVATTTFTITGNCDAIPDAFARLMQRMPKDGAVTVQFPDVPFGMLLKIVASRRSRDDLHVVLDARGQATSLDLNQFYESEDAWSDNDPSWRPCLKQVLTS